MSRVDAVEVEPLAEHAVTDAQAMNGYEQYLYMAAIVRRVIEMLDPRAPRILTARPDRWRSATGGSLVGDLRNILRLRRPRRDTVAAAAPPEPITRADHDAYVQSVTAQLNRVAQLESHARDQENRVRELEAIVQEKDALEKSAANLLRTMFSEN